MFGTLKIDQLSLYLLLEGHKGLRSEIRELGRKTDERFDMFDFKVDVLNQKIFGVDEKLGKKIDGVVSELKTYHADTEAHRGVYGVREE